MEAITWQQARAHGQASLPLGEGPVAKALLENPLHIGVLDFDAAVALGNRFVEWGGAIDRWLCSAYGVARNLWEDFSGRLALFSFKVAPLVPRAKPRKQRDEQHALAAWAVAAARLAERNFHEQRLAENSGFAATTLWKPSRAMREALVRDIGRLREPFAKTRGAMAIARLDNLDGLNDAGRQHLENDLAFCKEAAGRDAAKEKGVSVKMWACTALSGSASGLFAFLRPSGGKCAEFPPLRGQKCVL